MSLADLYRNTGKVRTVLGGEIRRVALAALRIGDDPIDAVTAEFGPDPGEILAKILAGPVVLASGPGCRVTRSGESCRVTLYHGARGPRNVWLWPDGEWIKSGPDWAIEPAPRLDWIQAELHSKQGNE